MLRPRVRKCQGGGPLRNVLLEGCCAPHLKSACCNNSNAYSPLQKGALFVRGLPIPALAIGAVLMADDGAVTPLGYNAAAAHAKCLANSRFTGEFKTLQNAICSPERGPQPAE